MANDDSAISEYDIDFQLYRYTPSLPAAIVSVIVFGILTGWHSWNVWRHRSFYFIPFTVGGLFQTLGYVGRALGHNDPEELGPFILQALLILLAPALYAASIYMILGRIIRSIEASHLSLIPIRWLTKIFVTGDILSFSLQGAGGGLQGAKSLEMFELGEKVILAGLFVQIVVFGIFVVTSTIFHRAILGSPTDKSRDGTVAWRRHLWVLYTVSAIILVRSIFRVVEYIQGNGGYLISHEIFLYVFDTILMAAVMFIFLVWYVDDLGAAARGSTKGSVELGSVATPPGTEGTGRDVREYSPLHTPERNY